jgi:hypothetical protein
MQAQSVTCEKRPIVEFGLAACETLRKAARPFSLTEFGMATLKKRGDRAVALKPAPKKKKPKSPRAPAAPLGGLIYSVHPGVAMMQKCIDELKTKTGRSLAEWMKHIKRAGPDNEKQSREWLKIEHSLGTNTAGWLAAKAFAGPHAHAEETAEGYLALAPQYVDQMYSGPKSALRPLHDELVRLALTLGSDVRVCPGKTIVPLYRQHVFAQIKPATNKRIDLGLALGGEPFTSRLRDTGGLAKKDRITHCVAISAIADIDLQVKRWLKQAYERDST